MGTLFALVVALAFAPFPSVPGNEPAVVWAVGDGADSTAAGRVHARRLARVIARDDPDRVIYLGDVYERGTAAEFERNMDGVYGALVGRMLPTPGNHDWPRHRTGYDPYWRQVTGAATPHRYSLRAGGWTLIGLNSEGAHGQRSAQARWLRARVDNKTTCRLAFWHRPRFSAGVHGDQKDVAPLWNALRGRASLVLGGHDHDLQRHRRRRDGLIQIVSGAGGRKLRAVDRSDPRLAFSAPGRYGAVRLVLRPGRARVDFIDEFGRRLDRSRVSCRR